MRILGVNDRLNFILTTIAAICLISCNEPSTDEKVYSYLRKAAEDASKSCPIQVDSVLKLENVIALQPAILRYNYTLKFDTVKYDFAVFKRDLTKTTINSVKTSPEGEVFRGLLTTFEYNYQDTLGNYLFRIIITPEDYMDK